MQARRLSPSHPTAHIHRYVLRQLVGCHLRLLHIILLRRLTLIDAVAIAVKGLVLAQAVNSALFAHFAYFSFFAHFAHFALLIPLHTLNHRP